MISLKQFLSSNAETDRTPAYVVRLLIEGIGQHPATGDDAEGRQFREKMAESSEAIHDQITGEDLLLRAGSVLSELEQYSQRATRKQRLKDTELQNMVRMLTSAVASISAASETNISKLGDIEKHVSVAAELKDVRLIKARLSECLVDIQKDAERQKKETEEIVHGLRMSVARFQKQPAGAPDHRPADAVTGLPLRGEAETAITDASRSGSFNFVAAMVVERLQILNDRFGREAIDEMMLTFVRMVQKSLTPQDRVFRWGGPALIALLTRPNTLEMVRGELTRIMETRLEHTIQTSSRSVLIPVSARWCLYPMTAAPLLLFRKIDEFAARPGMRP